jgi:hypothetical protein
MQNELTAATYQNFHTAEVCREEFVYMQASPKLFHLEKNITHAKMCALCIKRKKGHHQGCEIQTSYKCKHCDLPLCHIGFFLEYHKEKDVEIKN